MAHQYTYSHPPFLKGLMVLCVALMSMPYTVLGGPSEIIRTVTYSKPSSSSSAGKKPAAPAPAPHKKPHPSPACLDPSDLGVPFIHTCEDLKTYAMLPNAVGVQDGLDKCQWMDDMSCGSSATPPPGGGKKGHGEMRPRSPALAFNEMTPGVGKCLTLVKRFDGTIHIAGGSKDPTADILCCRPICIPEEPEPPQEAALSIVQTPPPTTTTPAPREALLSLDEKEPETRPPPQRPRVSIRPIQVLTTPPPVAEPTGREMCIAPEYLNVPRVRTCEDLRDVALSTNYITLTNMRAADCAWIDDYTCGPSYPGHGAYLTANLPDGACLGYRQSYCGNLVGPYPILQHDIKGVCARPGSKSHGNTQQQMMPIMIPVPNAPGKKGNAGNTNTIGLGVRRLEQSQLEDETPRYLLEFNNEGEAILRKLAGPNPPPGKKGSGESLVLCCRLNCGGRTSRQSVTQRTRMSGVTTQRGGAAGGMSRQRNTYNGNDDDTQNILERIYGDAHADDDSSRDIRLFASQSESQRNRIDICNPRYAEFCSLVARPMQNEEIVFDQHCAGANPPLGCFAGGLTCCRSVPVYEYRQRGY